jgi:protein-tyrosine phosphatase
VSIDTTRIKLDTNPQTKRMTGTTAHGYIPFDVPFMTEVAPNLWQGGCETGLVLPKHIKHLVSLYPWEAYKVRHELSSAVSVRMLDSTEQTAAQIPALAAWVNVCREDGPVAVHCQAGLNRSSLVVASALMLDGMTADAAIALIREKRSPACLCNPAFEEWLRGQDKTVILHLPPEELWQGGPVGMLATRTRNTLLRSRLKTIGEVAACSPADLMSIRDFGTAQLGEVRRVLDEAGLQLREVKAA